MCGIIGFIGSGNGIDTVLDGLAKLEYRGYDSAGLAYLDVTNTDLNNSSKSGLTVSTVKSVGHVNVLFEKIKALSPPADKTICIGHTRWATHGAVNETNAHPHLSADSTIAVVHNGIIENYLEIVSFLHQNGIAMKTETDTEVIPNLIQYYYSGDLISAVEKAIKHLQGSYAFAVLSAANPNSLVCVKHGMPLCIGKGKNFSYITSDIPTALSKTNEIYILENDELVIADKNKIKFLKNGTSVTKQPIKKTNNNEIITKGEFSTYMEKEINDIPAVFERLIAHYKEHKINDSILNLLNSATTIHICACGTAYHAGLVLGLLLETHCKIRTKVHIASEFRYQNPLLFKTDIGILISQSGETADTIAAMQLMKENQIPTIAFCNTSNSTIARETDHCLPTLAGFEIAVASTKAYCAQVLLAAILADALYNKQNGKNLFEQHDFAMLPMHARTVISKNNEIAKLAQSNFTIARMFFIGKGLDAVASLEAALKVKEITYMQCEGYPAGELKHGTLSLVDSNTLTGIFQTQAHLRSKTANAAAEVAARGSKTWTINVPDSPLSFTYSVIPVQLFALHLCILKNYNPDKPRNLAKSVTVE